MSTSPPAVTPESKGSRPTPGLLSRILRVQEAGLVLVILVLGALLALFGGTKLKPTVVSLQGAAVAETAQGYAIEDPSPELIARFYQLTTSKAKEQILDPTNFEGELADVRINFSVEFPHDERYLLGRDGKRVFLLGTFPMISQQQDSEGRVSLRVFRPSNKFLDLENLVSVANAASYIAIMAVGMTAIIAMGGIDLSVGSIYGLAAICGAWVLNRFGGGESGGLPSSLLMGLATCCASGALLGALNGSLIVGLKVHPFIISLGSMSAFAGVMFLITGGASISSFPPAFTTGFFKLNVGGIYPVPLIFMAIVAIAGTIMLRALVFGRHVMAIGGNETAARYAGIPVDRVKVMAYALLGLLAGLAACVSIGYFGAASPDSGRGYELKVITAAVIGGASLAGGRGSAIGAVLGAVVVQLIENGMLILQLNQNYTQIVMGVAIVGAVVLDQAKGRLSPAGR